MDKINYNKRQFFRTPIGLNITTHIKESNKKFDGFITDLSINGIGIQSENPLESNQFIELSFNFPNIDFKLNNMKAIVKWQRKDLNRFGAQWIDLKEEDKNILKHFTSKNV